MLSNVFVTVVNFPSLPSHFRGSKNPKFSENNNIFSSSLLLPTVNYSILGVGLVLVYLGDSAILTVS